MKTENKMKARQKKAEQKRREELKKKLIPRVITILAGVIVLVIIGLVIGDLVKNKAEEKAYNESVAAELSKAEAERAEMVVEEGDTVNIDFVGSVDGVEFEGGNTHGQGTNLVIGSHSYIDDFEDQLIGHKIGDTVDVYATFPEKYGNADLAGKEALFVVTINNIIK